MISIDFSTPADRPLEVLCLGAHSDDIEIGCGGAILKLIDRAGGCRFHWVVFSAGAVRDDEARRSAERFLAGSRGSTVVVKDFRNSFFPHVGDRIKEYFEELKAMVRPDLIFTHARQDLHQDHRVIHELTWNSFRNHLVLEYEIPKYDGDLGTPNFFVPLSAAQCERKVRLLMECFQTQRNKHWFTEDLFYGLMRLRGMECCAPERHAEAFYARKVCW
jgi:LmbE family N-acetylglucosaminyl deacetylase